MTTASEFMVRYCLIKSQVALAFCADGIEVLFHVLVNSVVIVGPKVDLKTAKMLSESAFSYLMSLLYVAISLSSVSDNVGINIGSVGSVCCCRSSILSSECSL